MGKMMQWSIWKTREIYSAWFISHKLTQATVDSGPNVPKTLERKVKVAARTRWWVYFIQDKSPDLFWAFASLHKLAGKKKHRSIKSCHTRILRGCPQMPRCLSRAATHLACVHPSFPPQSALKDSKPLRAQCCERMWLMEGVVISCLNRGRKDEWKSFARMPINHIPLIILWRD